MYVCATMGSITMVTTLYKCTYIWNAYEEMDMIDLGNYNTYMYMYMYVHKKPDLLTKNKNRMTSGDNEFQYAKTQLHFFRPQYLECMER